MESRSQRPPRLCERPPGGGTAPVEKPWFKVRCNSIIITVPNELGQLT